MKMEIFILYKINKKKIKIKTNFLNYASLRNSIKASLSSSKIQIGTNSPRPFLPHNIKTFCNNKKGTKHIYNILTTEKITPLGKVKWGKFFEILDLQWENIFTFPFLYTKDSKLQWLQFRINQYILTTNSFLFKIGKTDIKNCALYVKVMKKLSCICFGTVYMSKIF